jgi:hypothetical protein
VYTNVNLAAPIGALALLATGFILIAGAGLLIQSLIVRKIGRARLVTAAVLMTAIVYFGALLVFSAVSHDKLLARGEEKHFCELDCHLAYSIVNTRQAKTIEDNQTLTASQGQFTIVTIRTRFDEATIGPRRGDALLYPNSRALILIDQNGNRYGPAVQLAAPLTSPLRPGSFYTTDVAFDLPVSAKPDALLIDEDGWETHLVIGHENSPFHGKTKFQL